MAFVLTLLQLDHFGARVGTVQDINNSIISMLSQNSENDAKDADAVNNIAVDVDTAPNSAQQSTSSLPSVQARSLSPVPEVNDHADQDGAGDGLGTDQVQPRACVCACARASCGGMAVCWAACVHTHAAISYGMVCCRGDAPARVSSNLLQ